jgi:hypothetical protein
MTLNCSVSSSAPAITNVIMGYVNNVNYYLDLETASAADKKIVTDFLIVIGKHVNVDILDYTEEIQFETNIIIPEETDLEEITIEYSSLTSTKKTKVNNFVTLVKSLVSTENV